MKRKYVTMVELVIVIAIIIMLMIFSIFMLTSPDYGAVPAAFHIGKNYVKASIVCTDAKDYCNEIEFCDLNFGSGFFEEIDLDSVSTIAGKMPLVDYVDKYTTKQCQTKIIPNYNLKDLKDTLKENNNGEDFYFLINGVFYNSKYEKLNGIFDRKSGIRIMDGIIYF